ncbi:MAG: hypothetical protein JO255_04210 [Alphaproteobacteria bacterium]|nr:hypothetical protein [Alphaproteobacteria bacterium]
MSARIAGKIFGKALVPFLAAMLLAAVLPGTPALGGERMTDTERACQDMAAFWPLWSALSLHKWTDDDIQKRRFFPAAEVLNSLHDVKLTRPLPDAFGEGWEDYRPPNYGLLLEQDGASVGAQAAAYAQAAAAYYADDFATAIRHFDSIAAPVGRPVRAPEGLYRAAAAYTAARAAFRNGDFEDGGRRVGAILADDTLREFWAAAWKLIPRMRYGTDAAPLAAAELAQISRLLTTPASLLCNDPGAAGESLGKTLLDAAQEDFWVSRSPEDFMRPGIDYARAADPVIEALSLMPSYPAFDTPHLFGPWSERFYDYDHRWSAPWPRLDDPAHADPPARDHWQATRNPLWALELGKEGAERDLPALSDAISVVRSWPPDLSDRAKATLVWALAAEQARILLSAGKPSEALAALTVPTAEERQAVADRPPALITGAFESLVNGGIRYLAARRNLDGARQWAIATSTALHWSVAEPLKALLVLDMDELLHHPVLGVAPVDGVVRLGAWRGLLDGWPAAKLIQFARRRDIAPEDRRAAVGAAWIRAFALRRWPDVFDWLPDLRAAFPALAPDIDMIDKAWLPINRRHLALRLALRAPGLVVLPSWSRPPGAIDHWTAMGAVERPADVLAFDDNNPSDGNWWCSLETATALRDDREAFLTYLDDDIRIANASDKTDEATAPDTSDWNAIVPLLRGADDRELAALEKAGSATKRMAEDAVDWGKRADWLDRWLENDDALPETLHLAVRATRYGCRRPEDNAPWSRAAFKVLHERFRLTDWAKQTPYWFSVVKPAP